MKNNFFISVLTASFFILSNLHANGIRLYQESDRSTLHAMLVANEELLVSGNDFYTRVSETERYFDSQNYTTQVYVKNNELVGFILYTKEGFLAPFVDMNNFDPKKSFVSVLHGAIQLLYIQENYRRQAIGKTLVGTALEDMKSKKVKVVMLQTKVSNVAARSLYEKCGFKLSFPIMPGSIDCFYRNLP